MVFCLKDGEAKEDINTPDSQQLGEKMKITPDLINGEKVVICLKDKRQRRR